MCLTNIIIGARIIFGVLSALRGNNSVRAEHSSNVPRSYPVTSGSIHFISSFYLRYLLTYYQFYIKRITRASPSLHLIVPVNGAFIYIMRKSKVLDANIHSYVSSVGTVRPGLAQL